MSRASVRRLGLLLYINNGNDAGAPKRGHSVSGAVICFVSRGKSVNTAVAPLVTGPPDTVPGFIILAGIVGVAMTFAGVVAICAVDLLSKMPAFSPGPPQPGRFSVKNAIPRRRRMIAAEIITSFLRDSERFFGEDFWRPSFDDLGKSATGDGYACAGSVPVCFDVRAG